SPCFRLLFCDGLISDGGYVATLGASGVNVAKGEERSGGRGGRGGCLFGGNLREYRGRMLGSGPPLGYDELFFGGVALLLSLLAPDEEQATGHHQREQRDFQCDTGGL